MQQEDFTKDQKETVTVKCDACGANMVFDPATQLLKCPHCESVKDFEKGSNVHEIDILSAFYQGEEWKDESSVYRCENCGAVVVLKTGETATLCPYCQTSHVVKSSEMAGLKPNALYPFTLTTDNARESVKSYVKKKWFAPKKFKQNLVADNFKGVYQPCFTFDSSTHSCYVGKIGKRHTRTVGSGKNRRTETYIVWRSISGTHDEFFNDVLINGDSSYSQSTLNNILPYEESNIKEYISDYLTGYMAKRSDRKVEDCWNDAKSEMDNEIKKHILSGYSYDVVSYLNVSTTHDKVTYKYVLIPIYLLNYKYNKKLYTMHVNGNTGKVTGKTPVSPWKVLLTVGIGLIICFLIYLAFMYGE